MTFLRTFGVTRFRFCVCTEMEAPRVTMGVVAPVKCATLWQLDPPNQQRPFLVVQQHKDDDCYRGWHRPVGTQSGPAKARHIAPSRKCSGYEAHCR